MKSKLILSFCFWTTLALALAPTATELRSKALEVERQAQELERVVTELRAKSESLRAPEVPNVTQGRLTLTSGTAVTTSDVTNASTIYFTPYQGNFISLYWRGAWRLHAFSETSLTLSGLSANTNYDVFAYRASGGILTLELTAWTNNVTRATLLTTQDGVLVRTGATDRKYLGTLRATAATQTQDSASQRFVWNYYNRRAKRLLRQETTVGWSYAVAAWRQANANTANKVEVVVGWNEVAISGGVRSFTISRNNTTPRFYSTGVGLDTTTNNSSLLMGAKASAFNDSENAIWGEYTGYVGVGYHVLNWVENAVGGAQVDGGSTGATNYSHGMLLSIDC